MNKYAIWQNKQVVGYIEMTEEQKNIINAIHGIGIYIGHDGTTKPELYCKYYFDYECCNRNCEQCPIEMMR